MWNEFKLHQWYAALCGCFCCECMCCCAYTFGMFLCVSRAECGMFGVCGHIMRKMRDDRAAGCQMSVPYNRNIINWIASNASWINSNDANIKAKPKWCKNAAFDYAQRLVEARKF